MKTEPDLFSIDDLSQAKNQTAPWDGVRNYQARNFLRDDFRIGDGVLFYHSSTTPPGIAGEAVVVRAGYPDPTATGSNSTRPIWYAVDVKWVRTAVQLIPLERLRKIKALQAMVLLQRGMRLSVQSVTPQEWKLIMALPEWTDGSVVR